MKIQEQKFEEPWNFSRGETAPVFDIKSVKEQLQEVSDLMESDDKSEAAYAQKRAKRLQDDLNKIKDDFKEFDFYWKTRYKAFDRFMEQIKDFDFIKLDESVDTGEKYWYFTKHGVQPGSVPKGVNIEDIKDTTEGSYFLADKMLTTDELRKYEIIEKEPKDLKEETTPWHQIDLEDTDDEVDGFEWEIQHVKTIPDADGFTTQYALYKKTDGTKWITMYGDIDYNPPEEMYADMEFDNEQEALDFFNDYEGYSEIEGDDDYYGFDESVDSPIKVYDNYYDYGISYDTQSGNYSIYDANNEIIGAGYKSKDECRSAIEELMQDSDYGKPYRGYNILINNSGYSKGIAYEIFDTDGRMIASGNGTLDDAKSVIDTLGDDL